MKRRRSGGDQRKKQKRTVSAGASGGGGEGITSGGCGTPVSMVLDDDHRLVHMDLQALPDGCIANVVSLTTPRDACRFSAVSRSFMSIADSDVVWDRFLPSDIPSIRSHSSSSKKELYFTLCENPVLFNDRKMSFTPEKWSGKRCCMISAKDLMIAWGDNPDYWKWTRFADPRKAFPYCTYSEVGCSSLYWFPFAESRFEVVAVLMFNWWLEIRGKIDTRILSPSTVYKAYLVFMLSVSAKGFGPDEPFEVKVGLFGEEETISKRTVFLCQERSGEVERRGQVIGRNPRAIDETQYAKKRPDGWLEVEIGEFFCPGEEDGGLMEMTCREIKRNKIGLAVEGIEVRPKRV